MLCRPLLHWPVLSLVLVGALLSFPSRAAAHTDFESSTPADGDAVDEVVAEIVIRFTGAATPAGEGFTVLDPDGVVRSPSSVSTDDDKVFVLRFEPPLAGGSVGVRWAVQAQDAHPIGGSFSFTVTAPPPTSAAPPPAAQTTAAPATTAPSATPTTTAAPSTTEGAIGESADPAPAVSVPPTGGGATGGEVSLEEFLAVESSTPGDGRQLVGRVLSYLGVVGAVGGLAFLGLTLRGTPREIGGVLVGVAGLGVLVAVGAAIELWGRMAQSSGTVIAEMTSTPGVAMAFRGVGGAIIAGSIIVASGALGVGRRVRPARSLSASAVVEAPGFEVGDVTRQRWDPRTAPVTLAGASILVASYWFDGHTVSEGPRVFHAAVNSVHVVAAAVWVGGVAAMVGVLVARRRSGAPGRAAELVVRFSSIATVALAAVVVAGVAMAVFVLDSPGDLTTTEWGKVLLLKTAAVTVAALGGAYNHFRLRPKLEAAPDDGRLEAELRSTLIAEAFVLTFVVVVTAWLVAAAT